MGYMPHPLGHPAWEAGNGKPPESGDVRLRWMDSRAREVDSRSVNPDSNAEPPRSSEMEKVTSIAQGSERSDHDVRKSEAEAALQESEERMRLALESAQVGTFDWDMVHQRIFWSRWHEQLWGYASGEFDGTYEGFLGRVHPEDQGGIRHEVEGCVTTRAPFRHEFRVVWPDGSVRWIAAAGEFAFEKDKETVPVRMRGTVMEITQRRQAERLHGLAAEVLALLNNSREFSDSIQEILAAIKRTTDFDAVGIRLRKGDDFPYGGAQGFTECFLEAENTLAIRDAAGELCRDENGNPTLECTCGLVITGRTDSTNPLFTPGGSAWTNDARLLIRLPGRQDPRLNPRNRCIHEGFQSVALIPIRAGQENVGLLQLNDRRKNRFTVETVRFFEGLASAFGLALLRRREEQALRESESNLRTLFDAIPESVFVLDSEGTVLAGNATFADRLNRPLSACVGRLVDSLMPAEVAVRRRQWIHEMGRTKKPAVYEDERTGCWIRSSIYPVLDAEQQLKRIVVVATDITEQKQSQETLCRQDAEFRAMFDVASIGMAQADPVTGQWRRVNQRLCDITGYSAGEMLRMRMSDVTLPEDREVDGEMFRRLAQGETTHCRREKRYVRKDHSVIWVNVNMTVIRDAQGKPLGIMATIEDINERKRAQRRTVQDAERTELLLKLHQRASQMSDRQVHDYVLGKAVQLTESSIGFFLLMAETGGSILLTDWKDPTCPDVGRVGPSGSLWEECIQGRKPVVDNDPCSLDSRVKVPAGCRRLNRLLAIPVVENDRVIFILGVANKDEDYVEFDVSQIQIVANELHKILLQRAAQERLRKLSGAVEQSPVSVVITDTSGAIEYVNPMFTRTTGYTLEEVRGQNPRVLGSGEKPAQDYQELWRTILDGKVWHGEFHNRRKNGELYWETASISPIRDSMGQVTHFVAVKEDVTKLRQLEAQYRQAQKLEAVGQLAGGVAHDFNNILAGFMMQLQLMEGSPGVDSETQNSLDELQKEALRAVALTRQLLMFSRRSVLVVRPLDLNEVVANLLKMLTRLIGENIDLAFTGKSGLPKVEADVGLLEQVLMNLVVNARDAMPGGGRITMGTQPFTVSREDTVSDPSRRPGLFVCLTVSDTGCGMDDLTLKRIFEPFFTTKEPGRGTGLGLATVHGIVAQHQGWVEVESRVGAGSTFRVLLPALASPIPAPEPTVLDVPMLRGQETILLVEDEDAVRRLTARVLREFGYCVHEAANGQAAIRVWDVHSASIDLLLTDMVMPEGLTGLELATQLQARKPALKVIISSGYSAEIFKSGAPIRKGLVYLPKPCEAKVLAALVRNLLDAR